VGCAAGFARGGEGYSHRDSTDLVNACYSPLHFRFSSCEQKHFSSLPPSTDVCSIGMADIHSHIVTVAGAFEEQDSRMSSLH
jgi:hypothetical protein